MNEGAPGRRVIDDRFELEARLGGGGMGTVWRARDLVLDRAVALKEVRPPDPGLAEYDPEAARQLRERVLREARALARVEHPNVVTIHHVVDGAEHVYPWLVMELVTGGSLEGRLARGPMAPGEAARLGRELLGALRAAHSAGIQHRDVKPANVLLRPDGRPVLTDFGIAAIRESTALTATGSVIGTPDYMAPERISGGDGGPESDLWSLAMMLYVAVEGHHPLRRATTLATLAAVLREELPPPVRAGALTPLLVSVLAKDPALRPDVATMDAMLARAETDDSTGAAPGPGTGPAAGTGAGGFGPPPGAVPPTSAGAMTSYALAPPGSQYPGSQPTGSQNTGPQYPGGQATGSPYPGAHPVDSQGTGPQYPGARLTGSGTTGPHANPYATSAATPNHPYEATAPVGTQGGGGDRDDRLRRRIGRILIGSSVASMVLIGVLLWNFLPDGGGDPAGAGAADSPGASASDDGSGAGTPAETPADNPAETPGETPAGSDDSGGSGDSGGGDEDPSDLLTPDGIRTALAALKKATGTDQMSSLSVYPEYVSADVMVKGSKSRYESWSYRPGEGATKGIINGSVGAMDSPFDVDAFDWDAVPALFERAEKELNVKDVTSRYLAVNGDDPTFGDPKHMAAYLINDYSQSGYLTADPDGKVIDVYPNEDAD
ncbi:serine/threonine-protein kinase [Streptomyces sp. NPDC093252]|uniref:serine/threonine-protein kinase n=1 Tax=Streptomyces sp. NPDC093252 TaxID=3154980 RepID=UPI003415F3FB